MLRQALLGRRTSCLPSTQRSQQRHRRGFWLAAAATDPPSSDEQSAIATTGQDEELDEEEDRELSPAEVQEIYRNQLAEMSDSPWSPNARTEVTEEPLFVTPRLSAQQVAAAMYDSVHDDSRGFHKAFYSSVLGGITQERGLMTIPMDDHMVHRGHGVFDTAMVIEGNAYMLDRHLQRFEESAKAARIPLWGSTERMKRVLLDTAAVGATPNGFLRYWMSAGRGGYSLSGNDTLRSEFYAIFYNGPWTPDDISKPWKVWSSEIPNKPGEFARVKSVDYMQNAVSLMEAQANGADHGIFLNPDGTICEGNTYNVALITHDGVLKTPPFESCLAGCTLSRIIELLEQRMEKGEWTDHIKRIERVHFTLDDVANAFEVFLCGGALPIKGISHWNGRPIHRGEVESGTVFIWKMLDEDTNPPIRDWAVRADPRWDRVPYGALSGMHEDMPGMTRSEVLREVGIDPSWDYF